MVPSLPVRSGRAGAILPYSVSFGRLELAYSSVRFFRQLRQSLEELRRLPGEQPVVRQRCYGRLSACESVIARSDHRAVRQVRVDEFAGNGEDQAGLNQIGRLQWWIREKIREREAGYGVRKRRHGRLHAVTCEISPLQEVSDLVSANTDRDLQHFQTGDFTAKRRIETRSTLFDHSEVKSRYIRDRLDMIVSGEVRIGSSVEIVVVPRNGGNIVESQRLRESAAEVWIGRTAVANVPTGVDVELHEVGEA